jgi:WD40 repeat protein
MMDIRDTFGYPKQTQSPQNMSSTNVTITDVAWSPPQSGDEHYDHWLSEKDSFLAAAGSNGVFCIWNACHAFLEGSASTMGYPPDAVRSHSSRAVNRLAWHPRGKYHGNLLTASQDGTVKLWVRKLATLRTANERKHDAHRSWFGQKHASRSNQSYSWECSKTFSPRCEAIREVRWSPFHDNSKQHVDVSKYNVFVCAHTILFLLVFALVTDSGHLIVYNINHSEIPWEKIAAHDTGASTLDWHPTRPYVIATGGSADRSVKSTIQFILCGVIHDSCFLTPFQFLFSLGSREERRSLQTAKRKHGYISSE